jgi:hypothetical protein
VTLGYEEEHSMGRISVHEFVSLDGVFENPAWTGPYGVT